MLSSTDVRRVSEHLRSLGCNQREAVIYLQCLQMGPASVQEIAKSLRTNRVTVHSAVEQLIAKQLLFETRRGKRRLIVAEEPTGLRRLLQKKENELLLMRQNLERVIPILSSVQSMDQSIPTVRIYEGADGFKRMLEETLTAKGELLVFSYVDLFSKLVGPEYLEQYFRRRAAKGVHSRLLFPSCSFVDRVIMKQKEHLTQIRTLPPTVVWKSGIFSWNNCLALLSFTEQKLTCTIIENLDIAHFFRTVIFEMCWKQASQ